MTFLNINAEFSSKSSPASPLPPHPFSINGVNLWHLCLDLFLRYCHVHPLRPFLSWDSQTRPCVSSLLPTQVSMKMRWLLKNLLLLFLKSSLHWRVMRMHPVWRRWIKEGAELPLCPTLSFPCSGSLTLAGLVALLNAIPLHCFLLALVASTARGHPQPQIWAVFLLV